jgi:hypothetical protein
MRALGKRAEHVIELVSGARPTAQNFRALNLIPLTATKVVAAMR